MNILFKIYFQLLLFSTL